MTCSVDQKAHAASKRGGWGVRMYGGFFVGPSGSSLNNYSGGDVVCWDEREDAETAAREYMQGGLYTRCDVELVAKGQIQKSINEERQDIAVAQARALGRTEVLEEARKYVAQEDEDFAGEMVVCIERTLGMRP